MMVNQIVLSVKMFPFLDFSKRDNVACPCLYFTVLFVTVYFFSLVPNFGYCPAFYIRPLTFESLHLLGGRGGGG